MINENAQIERDHDILTSEIDLDLGLLNIETGYYYTLDDIGKDIWDLIESKISVESVVKSLLSEYDTDYDTCKNDVIELFESLEEHSLVKIWR